MAGPYYTTIKSKDGRVINIYHAASVAVGKYLPVEQNGGVASDSAITFTISTPFLIDDWYTTVPDATPNHQIEIVKNDNPTGRFLVPCAAMAATNNARKVQELGFTPGVYKLVVRVAGPA